ncbi:TIGR03118 family protein [Steroidobacter flavus]|uniref:TIGR03118 family protein n=1 Tax=Steroidobacter flavus TaxID=1842136 RepID=A0ABV8T1T0_9GAMM
MSNAKLFPWSSFVWIALTLPTLPALAHDNDNNNGNGNGNGQTVYESKVLVSNGGIPANFTDPNLINGWGVAFNPNGFVWVNAADAGKSVLYDGNGQPQSLVVTVPGPGGGEGNPTGIVFSGGMDFVVSNGTTNGPARFLFATEQGTIAGWAPNVNATNAIQAVDNSSKKAHYTGLALSGNGTTHLLYAANFSQARIDVFDGTFKSVSVPGGFTDSKLPKLYAPFGIQAIGGDIYVTYAKQEEEGGDEEEQGAGLGIVNVFDPEGHLIRRIATRGPLNAPWGIALAPASFGGFGGALLIGNLGDGTINAFGPRSGKFLGALSGADHKPLHVDGLWGMQFGNGISGQETNSLFWAAGPNDESDGAYGVISAVSK